MKRRPKWKEAVRLNKCRYCKSTENLTVDHKVPISQGGTNDPKNLQCLCSPCNSMKSGLSHNQVMSLFKWFAQINADRIAAGKRPYGVKKLKE